ncbi:MAG: fatty acid CoA ligase family protein, partial [Opitutaceae bacterium]
MSNIASHLPLMASRTPTIPALKIPRGRSARGDIDYLSLSFAELEGEAAAWQRKLATAGAGRGDRALVMVRPGLPLIASVFALFAMGAIPVVIDPGMGLRSFLSCVRRSRPRVLVGVPFALLISRIARGSFRGVAVRVGSSGRLDARLSKATKGEAASDKDRLVIAPTQESDQAAIFFTSGSTGAPKGVCYEHGMFQAQVRLVRETYGIEPGEVDLPLLPIFALFNPALGMTTIVPEIDPRKPATVDPARIVQAILQEGVTNLFGSPTLWRIVADHCLSKGIELPSLKRVLCAGAPVPASLWADSYRFLPKGAMHSPYGATEALPVSSVSAARIDLSSLKGAHVGTPVPEAEVKIIELDDNPIADIASAKELFRGSIGEIIVKGPMVSRCYDQLPEATAMAKIQGEASPAATLTGAGFWHRMGDTGFLDENGDLWFCGRKAERVETKDGPMFTEPCERVFRQHPRAQRCALIGLGSRGGQRPAIVVETKVKNSQEARNLSNVLRHLALQHPQTAKINLFYFHPK